MHRCCPAHLGGSCLHGSAWPPYQSAIFNYDVADTLKECPPPTTRTLTRSHGADGRHPTIRREEEFDEDRMSGEYYSGEEFYEDDSMLSGDRCVPHWACPSIGRAVDNCSRHSWDGAVSGQTRSHYHCDSALSWALSQFRVCVVQSVHPLFADGSFKGRAHIRLLSKQWDSLD